MPVLIFCLAMVAAAGYGVGHQPLSTREATRRNFPPVPDIYIPAPDKQKAAERLTKTMNTLAYPSEKVGGIVDLRIFGGAPIHSTSGPHTFRRRPAANYSKTADYRLTLVFAAGKSGFCLIDGTLYGVNETLPDGGVVRQIQKDRVQIEKPWGQVWVPMARALNENDTREGDSNE
ncbi:MAG: hypothetical protein SWH61_08865 [Thermodesulfobacteriota bacterium]|nr:hypothetical protein [Thermodesulfobacteriota bacterium]